MSARSDTFHIANSTAKILLQRCGENLRRAAFYTPGLRRGSSHAHPRQKLHAPIMYIFIVIIIISVMCANRWTQYKILRSLNPPSGILMRSMCQTEVIKMSTGMRNA